MARPRTKRQHAPPTCGQVPHPHRCLACAAKRARAYRKRHKPAIADRRAQSYASLEPEEKKKRSRRNAISVLLRRGSIVRRPCELCEDADVGPYFASPNDPARAVRWLCRICMPYAEELPPAPETLPRKRKRRRAPVTCRNGHPRQSHGPCPTCRNARMTRYRQHRDDRVRRVDRQRKRSYRASPRYQLQRARQRIAEAIADRVIRVAMVCENDPCRNQGKLAAVLDPAEEARVPLHIGWWWMCQPCAAQWIATHETTVLANDLPTISLPPAPVGKVLGEDDLARIDAELSAFDAHLDSIITRIKNRRP